MPGLFCVRARGLEQSNGDQPDRLQPGGQAREMRRKSLAKEAFPAHLRTSRRQRVVVGAAR